MKLYEYQVCGKLQLRQIAVDKLVTQYVCLFFIRRKSCAIYSKALVITLVFKCLFASVISGVCVM